MKQVTKKKTIKTPVKSKSSRKTNKTNWIFRKKAHKQEYGTSKLEEKFAREFLDKIGVEYVYQYKAESIGRYFDFRIMPKGPIIEIQGSYWHGDSRLYEEKDLNATQRRDIKIDELKKKWCTRNGIPIIYIWELDINKNPKMVLNYLKEVLKPYLDGSIDEKSKRH